MAACRWQQQRAYASATAQLQLLLLLLVLSTLLLTSFQLLLLLLQVAPTFHLYKGGQKVADMTGAKVDKLRELITQHTASDDGQQN